MPYLTVAEYLDRFGEMETKRLTDETRSGEVDTAKVEEAIADSGEEVDSFLANRYSTPLGNPPRLVKGFVAVLARWRLYKTTATQQVKDEADLARSQLDKLSRGIMKLPSETGPVPEDARPSADSASSGDGPTPIFTEETMAGFSVPGIGSGVARWRQ